MNDNRILINSYYTFSPETFMSESSMRTLFYDESKQSFVKYQHNIIFSIINMQTDRKTIISIPYHCVINIINGSINIFNESLKFLLYNALWTSSLPL